jgi:intracellular multiplication protein IcmP
MAEDNNTLHDNAVGWFILALVFAAFCWLIWYLFDAQIRDAIRWVRYGEMWLLHFFIPADYTITFDGKLLNWHDGYKMVPRWQAEEMQTIHMALISALAMQPLRVVFTILVALAGFWVLTSGPRTHNRRKLGLEGLISHQAKNFPVIAPFITFDPSKQPPRPPGTPVPAELPSFAEALGPEEWLAYNSIPAPDGKLDRKATSRAFQRQLIGRWKGVKALPPYQKVLLAAFCLKAARKRNLSDDMLGRMAKCWSHEKGLRLASDNKLLGDAIKVLKTESLSAKTLAECNKHAFVTTALLRALQFAREEGGVLAPAQFVWLRAHDRTLWYPLNNLGRQSFHMEALGAMTHFKEERMTQRPIPTPKVERAVDSISDYMASGRARPIPELNYANSKKKAIKKAV